jgi:ParB/RepB/Spo0J family partition protein
MARLKTVDPRKIHVPEVRVTSDFDNETLAMFKASVKDLGILEPPVCMEHEGELIVVDGLHRIIEAINNGSKSIQVVVMEGDMRDALLKNLALNNLRGKIKPTEIMACVKELFEVHHMGTDDVAKETGFSRDYVERMIIISRAQPRVLEALDDGVIGLGQAELLAKIADPTQQLTVLDLTLTYRLTIPRLRAAIADIELELARRVDQPPPPPAGVSQPVKCHYCGEAYDVTLLQNPTTCMGCFAILVNAMAQARSEAAHEAAAPREPAVPPQ